MELRFAEFDYGSESCVFKSRRVQIKCQGRSAGENGLKNEPVFSAAMKLTLTEAELIGAWEIVDRRVRALGE